MNKKFSVEPFRNMHTGIAVVWSETSLRTFHLITSIFRN